MSAEAAGYVWKHSLYRGATLMVHLAIADVANDLHDHKFWMAMPTLAKKARVTTRAAQKAVQLLVRDGFLEVHEPSDIEHWKPTTYRFLFPEPAVVEFTPGEHSSPPPGELRSPPGELRSPYPNQNPNTEQPKLAIARTRAQKVSWPADFTLTEELAAMAIRQGLDAKYQWGKFKAHALRDDVKHVNWLRAWEYWLRNAWEIENRRHG